MSMRVPEMPFTHGQPEIFWYESDGYAPPASIEAVVTFRADVRWPLAASAICVCRISRDDAHATIAGIRRAVGQEAYLIGLVEHAPDRTIVRKIDAGLDDAVWIDDADGFMISLARGRRVVADRRQSHAFRQRYALERDYLQACIDNLPTPIFFKNGRGVYVGCNKAFEAYLGLSSDEIIGSTVWDIAPSELAGAYEEADHALMASGGVQVYEGQVRYSDGNLHDVSFHKAVIVDGDGAVRGLAGAMLDITDRKLLEQRLKQAAECDPLTGLYNRRKFFERASEIPSGAGSVTVAVVDIDHFKAVNDGYGHSIGDHVLCRVAEIMQRETAGETIFARAGGEEFYAMIPGCSLPEASAYLEGLRRKIAALEIDADGTPIGVTISIGLAGFDPARETVYEGIKSADIALYQAKNSGRNQLVRAA